MTPSPAYRVCVEKLERVLSPRVASRSLHAAMNRDGVTPQEATPEQLEPILKGDVFKQLQVAMPPDDARDYVKEMLAAMEAASVAGDAAEGPQDGGEAEAPEGEATGAPAEAAEAGDRSTDADADRPDGARSEAATSDDSAPAIDPAEYARLREAARPYNLYFTWPEVRRLRALLARIEDVVEGADDGEEGTLVEEAERSLANVQQTLEDRLVLQAQELAVLEEAYAEVAELGDPKVRRLDNMIKRVREAQEDRQLADAELERANALSRDLRKMMASSVFQSSSDVGNEDLEARIKALDVDAELAELDSLARNRAVLLEHRPDLADRLSEAREQVASGLTLGDELAALKARLEEESERRRAEVERELSELSARLDQADDAWTSDLRREHAVLLDILRDDGLPPLADVVRFRDQAELALDHVRSAGERAEAATAEAQAQLDLQGDLLDRAQHELLRYQDHEDDPAVERLREAVDELRSAQAEERTDADAQDAVREASDALAQARRDDEDPAARARAELSSLIGRLDGLPASLDPEGTAELRADLEAKLDDPPGDAELASLAAVVSDAVDAAREAARRRLDALSREAGTWQLSELLDAVRDANERLEDGGVPALGDLDRDLHEAIEQERAEQLARLHQLERDAERLVDIDEATEHELAEALGRARTQVGDGTPATALDEVERSIAALEDLLERRLGDVMPRLDAALNTFETVERLNSDEVATVRRILHHLDGQRDAFARVSPALRARMERSLQEAEDLLAKLVEEEEATRAIADQLMAGSTFDDLLAGLGDAPAASSTADGPDAATDASDPGAWLDELVRRRDVVAAGLLASDGTTRRDAGLPAQAADDAWAQGASDIVGRFGDLGRALELGAPRVLTFEHEEGCLLLGHDREGTALLAGSEPGTLGLLVQELRDDGWRKAAGALAASTSADESTQPPEAGADGAPDAG